MSKLVQVTNGEYIGANKYTIKDAGGGKSTVDFAPDSVIKEGTPVGAELLNEIQKNSIPSLEAVRRIEGQDEVYDCQVEGIDTFVFDKLNFIVNFDLTNTKTTPFLRIGLLKYPIKFLEKTLNLGDLDSNNRVLLELDKTKQIANIVSFLSDNKNKANVVATIEELKSSTRYKVGDIVEVLGYYAKGDGADHKRKIESKIDVYPDNYYNLCLSNGLWAKRLNSGRVEKKQIMLHKNGNFSFLENSLQGLEMCGKFGAEMVEVDIRKTLDGIYVVCHDNNLKFLTGVDKNINEITYNELKTITMKNGKTGNNLFPNGVNIPKMSDYLYLANKYNIECVLDCGFFFLTDTPEEQRRFLNEIKESGAKAKISINNAYGYVEAIKTTCPEVGVICIISDVTTLQRDYEKLYSLGEYDNNYLYLLNKDDYYKIDENFRNDIISKGCRFAVPAFNQSSSGVDKNIKKLFADGVSIVMTDKFRVFGGVV